jgi:predicted enzyme related to lactoylglutathione lyase
MIQRLVYTTVYVLDQDRAKTFYTEKLGFEVRDDQRMGDFRWLTVSPPGQKDCSMVLMPLRPSPMMDESTVNTLRTLVEKGTFGVGVLETDDCQKTYEELKAKGVVFSQPPQKRPYGIEALLRDDSGNFFSMTQRERPAR